MFVCHGHYDTRMNNDLNPQQRQALKHIQGPLLVLAGAGSGKTKVITHKIAHLIDDHQVPAKSITAVTFTNKAAREMDKRVRQIISRQSVKGLNIATFHALGLDMLRKEHQAAGLKRHFSIFDARDSQNLLGEIAASYFPGVEVDTKIIYQTINQWKNDLIEPDQACQICHDDESYLAARFYRYYQDTLQLYNAVDFADLLNKPVHILQNNPELCLKWQYKTRYLLVDEYQDTNVSQYRLIQLLTGYYNNFTLVGDDAQSIYAWRGARVENLLHIQKDYPHLEVIKLEQNYRSFGRILQTANQLIAHNERLFSKNLWSQFGVGEPLQVLVAQDVDDEAEQIVQHLVSHQFRYRSKLSDYAILYRSNFQARALEKSLRKYQVPYYINGGSSIFERHEIRDLLAYLRLLINPEDDTATLRVINTPRRGIGPQSLGQLVAYAKQRQVPLVQAMGEIGLTYHVGGAPLEGMQYFAELISQKRQVLDEFATTRIIQELLDDIDYISWLYESANSSQQAEKQYQNLQDFIQWLGKLAQKEPEASFADLINKIILIDRLSQDDEQNYEQVQLMTLHAAKGLEFPYVYMIGMEEGLLPHQTSIEQETIEEERRLAYVGITRAQKHLTFSLAEKRTTQGELVERQPSRFLQEIDSDHLHWQGGQQKRSPEQQQAHAQQHLDQLKAILNNDD